MDSVNPWVGLNWVENFHNYSGLGWVKSLRSTLIQRMMTITRFRVNMV